MPIVQEALCAQDGREEEKNLLPRPGIELRTFLRIVIPVVYIRTTVDQ